VLQREAGPTEIAAPPSAVPVSGAGPLPSLETLVERIPPPLRAALDEHVRARFVRVRRLKPGELR